MLGLEFVRPLEDDWRATLDAVATAHGWPTSQEPHRLSACVAELSAAYNDRARARADMKRAGAARLSFSFPRDVPKSSAAFREVIGARAIDATEKNGDALRVLDLGAGLGAMTWGLARALDAAGLRTRVHATWVDAEAEALDVGRAILRARSSRVGGVELEVRTEVAPVASLALPSRGSGAPIQGPFDVTIAGQLLSELDVGDADDARVERHADLLGSLLDAKTAPGGFLVVVEPALRDRTRHLHRVRDALVASKARPSRAVIFAPCLHRAPCPMLAHPGDWCHEDLAIDLPSWLVPVARAAGLRYQGLTFSYLVLRREGPELAALLSARRGVRLRVVSNRRATKGKSEVVLCGDFRDASRVPAGTEGVDIHAARVEAQTHEDANAAERGDPAAPGVSCVSVARLDRDAVEGNRAWDAMARGDIACIDPSPKASEPAGVSSAGRVRSTTAVELVGSSDVARGNRGGREG